MADEDGNEERQLRQLRLLGAGTLIAGLLVVAVAATSSEPYDILIVTLGFLGVSALVFEQTQGATVGISLGLLTSGVVVWLWPHIGTADTEFAFVGAMLVAVGAVNVAAAPVALRLRRFGESLGQGGDGEP